MNFTAQSDSYSPHTERGPSLSASASTGNLSTKAKGKQRAVDNSDSASYLPTLGIHTPERGRHLNGKAITTPKMPSRMSKRSDAPIFVAPEPPPRPKKRMSFSMATPTPSPVPLKKRKSTLDGEPSSPYPTRTAKLENVSHVAFYLV